MFSPRLKPKTEAYSPQHSYLNEKEDVENLGVSEVVHVSLQVQVGQHHHLDQKHCAHDGHGSRRRGQRQEVEEEVPGVPGPDAVVHPNTVVVETVHTPVTHTCTATESRPPELVPDETATRTPAGCPTIGLLGARATETAAAATTLPGLQCPGQQPPAQPPVASGP